MSTRALPVTAGRGCEVPPRRFAWRLGGVEIEARHLLLWFLAWTALAAIPTTSAFIVAEGRAPSLWLRFFRPIATYYYLWALVTPLVYVAIARLAAHGPVLAAAGHAGLLAAISSLAVFPAHGERWRVWLYGANVPAYHVMSAFTYAFVCTGCLAYRYYRIGLEREREAARMRLRAAELDGQLSLARIDALRTQINPHFLFNALNSIGALIETARNDEAYRTTELLGELLRTALDASRRERVPLAEELTFVSRYVEIERVRFGDKLRYECRVDPSVEDVGVPMLLLQPLVENAVKHAVAPSVEPVSIVVTARRDGMTLRLSVEDDGAGPHAGTSRGTGQGLHNVRERLRLSYGEGASAELSARQPRGTAVVVTIPIAA